jgi:hypothetical protein
MIASKTLDQFVTVDGSRNHAQEGDVRLLASEEAASTDTDGQGRSGAL